jgi:hypothetical protein
MSCVFIRDAVGHGKEGTGWRLDGSATSVAGTVIESRNSNILAAVGMIVAVPAATLSVGETVSMSASMAARIPAIRTVTHAHRPPGVIVSFLFDIVQVTSSTRLETYRLATSILHPERSLQGVLRH